MARMTPKEKLDKLMAEAHIVKDYYIGNTHILIADNFYRDKTPEEIQAIKDRCYKIVYDALLKKAVESGHKCQYCARYKTTCTPEMRSYCPNAAE